MKVVERKQSENHDSRKIEIAGESNWSENGNSRRINTVGELKRSENLKKTVIMLVIVQEEHLQTVSQ
uniref:Uncharacterized protein n=1 Tax=Romanomermis culicivorax TaxID=13658 RepID=A0A915JPX5_ROMCU